jgi:hypothetical protein
MKLTADDDTRESRQVETDETDCSSKVMSGILAMLAPEQAV